MEEKGDKINQSQFFELITGEELSWQSIIFDLIKSEQLDPWDIDIAILADKYAETIEELEEADFFVSSKVLLACSLLLRLKSEIFVNEYIEELNEELYGIKGEKKEIERIEIDEGELPVLVPRTPIPRSKKVTLNQLMSALNKAIETENRRIKKEIKKRQAEKSALVVMPKNQRVPLKQRIKIIYQRIKGFVYHPDNRDHMTFHEMAPSKEEKLSAFLPVLHLSNDQKLYLHQREHFNDIYMSLEMLEEELKILRAELGEAEKNMEEENTEYIDIIGE